MDLETLTLVKLLLVAGLAWLSFRKIKRMEAQQLQIKSKHEACMLQEMLIIEKIKLKEESCLSTSASSKPQVSYQEYNSIYDKFWEKNEQLIKQDQQMEIEQPLIINQFSELKMASPQNPSIQSQIKISEFSNLQESYSCNDYKHQTKDTNKMVKNKYHWFDRFTKQSQDKPQKLPVNHYKKTIVKAKKQNHLFSKSR